MRTPPRPTDLPQLLRIVALALPALVLTGVPLASIAQDSAVPPGWVPFDGVTPTATSPAIEVVSSTSGELVLELTTPGAVSDAVQEGAGDYRRLEFPGYSHSDEVGHPLLPAVRQLIAVPRGCEIEVSVAPGEPLHYFGTLLYPVPATVVRYTPEGWEYLAEEFAIDEDAYSESGYYPSAIAGVSDEGSLRGQGVALLTVYPAQYDAHEMDLRVYPRLTVTLRFIGGEGGLSTNIGPFGGIARGVVLNYQGMAAGPTRGSAGPGNWGVCGTVSACVANETDFLMIVHDSLIGAAPDPNWPDSLAKHRAEWNGWNVAIVPSDSIVAHSQSQEMSDVTLKEFIQAVYEECEAEHMDDGKLGYVLLVGDAKDAAHSGAEHWWLPAHQGPLTSTTPRVPTTTDHWYACVDGEDDYADLMIGRMAADHRSEVGREVQKIIDYEESASSEDAWRDNVLLSCGFAWSDCDEPGAWCECDDERKAGTVHGALASVQGAYFDSLAWEVHAHAQSGSHCQTQYGYTTPLNRAAVNTGCHFVELCVHGYPHGTYTFDWGDADSLLTNVGMLPFWMSYSCQTGAFDELPKALPDTMQECLGERLLHNSRVNGAGAVAYFGSTENTTDSAWECLGTYLWQAFFDEDLHTLGDAIAFAKLKDLSMTGNTAEILMFNLLGDPALNVFMTDTTYGSKPDYAVDPDDLRTSPSFPPASGTAYLEAVIHNRSNYDPDDDVAVELVLCERDGSACDTLDLQWVRPGAWSADTARVVWEAGPQSAAGHRILRVRVDPDDEQDELIEGNNDAENHVGNYFTERPGFPVMVGGLAGFSPIVAEINNDDTDGPEVVVVTRDGGRMGVYSCSDGDSLWTLSVPDSQAVRSSPAVGDLDADGSPEIVVCCGDSVKAYHADRSRFWGHYVEGLDSGPVLGDFIDGDGRLETVVTWGSGEEFDALLSALFISHDGQPLREEEFESTLWTRCSSSLELCPAAAHLDSDGRVDMVASYERGIIGSCAGLVAADGDGDWSRMFTLGGGDEGGVHPCNPVVGEVDPSSAGLEVLAGARTLDWVGTIASTPTLLNRETPHGYLAGVSLADLDSDGALEVAAATYGAPDDPDSVGGRVYVFEGGGGAVDWFPLEYGCTGQPVIADLDANGDPELLVSSTRPYFMPPYGNRDMSHLDILTLAEGGLVRFIERPLLFWGRLTSTPAIRDTDGDDQLEIWLVDGEGNLHCLEYEDLGTPSRWSCYQHDERHAGVYETPVTGQYPPNTTASWWGDYYMTGDVAVDSTSALVVQPGTTVRVAIEDDQESGADPDFVELIARHGRPGGRLRVGGDPLRPVVFGSAAESPTEEDWLGIRLRPRSTGIISNATISHASQAIYAQKPDTLSVTGCDLLENAVRGIRCRSEPDTMSQVLIHGNRISETIIGISLYDCEADVGLNEVWDCSGYGMEVCGDEGSIIHDNSFLPAQGYLSFAGIIMKGSAGSLWMARNVIGDTLSSVHNIGINYENSAATDAAVIRDNTVRMHSGLGAAGTGMYFYDAKPRVRENTIAGVALSIGFFVDGMSWLPSLGEAVSGSCTACDDTTLGGCNRVLSYKDSAEWCVYADRRDSVWAQCNYWYPEPQSGQFHGYVAWDPYLEDDPGGGRGQPEPVGGEEGDLPLAPELLPNTPNPFNPETVFRFAVPEATDVKLEVYDLAGRHVRTLVDGLVQAGWQTARWDGRSDRGGMVASGVYFCRLEAGSRELSRKVVVLK